MAETEELVGTCLWRGRLHAHSARRELSRAARSVPGLHRRAAWCGRGCDCGRGAAGLARARWCAPRCGCSAVGVERGGGDRQSDARSCLGVRLSPWRRVRVITNGQERPKHGICAWCLVRHPGRAERRGVPQWRVERCSPSARHSGAPVKAPRGHSGLAATSSDQGRRGRPASSRCAVTSAPYALPSGEWCSCPRSCFVWTVY